MMRLSAPVALTFLMSAAVVFGQEPRGVLYDFTAVWCAPCQQMAPIVEKLQREGLPIQKVDVDQQRDLTARFNIQQMPTFLLLVDGKEVDRVTGRMTESDLRRMAARIPTQKSAASASAHNPLVNASRSSGQIPIELGQAAPLVRPAPIQPARDEVRVAETEQKRGIRDRIPFGRKDKAETPAVVRGNDSSVGGIDFGTSNVSVETPADPMDSSVRIRVITNGRIDLGSGTVISSQQGISQILTCAHIFNGFSDDSRIEVDLFENGRPAQFLARLIKYDKTSDIGLISIPTTSVIRSSKVASVEHAPKVGESVSAIGCSGGEEPTRQQSRITDIDKFDGPHNLLCVGVPVRGRSGGGLFNGHGEVIGVCSAADEPAQRGFYSGLLAIHQLLDQCSLAHLYQPAPKVEAPFAANDRTPSSPSDFGSAGTPRELESSPFASMPPQQSAPATTPSSMAMAGGMAPSSLDVQAGGAEVVVIIRDPAQPNAPNRVVILHQASPKFLSYLSGELKEGAIDTGLLGAASTGQHVPEIERSLRNDTMSQANPMPVASRPFPSNRPLHATEAKPAMQPTTMSRPVIPKKYSRSREP